MVSLGGYTALGDVLFNVRLLAANALDYSIRFNLGEDGLPPGNYADIRLVVKAFYFLSTVLTIYVSKWYYIDLIES